ncbi:hypothetical protein [Actinomadura xylanilytica]|uniref:hypothetical protein n=1 Tax=Actinomadura xylanilytica TaxID=887459 RepID=UPI00255B3604|nr:hypothetical protein [Actinomadura xylanilytica]MDL4775207.1 hypothetical protein [Actinomadura xylanilytica]
MYDQDESDRTAAGAGHGDHEDADTVLASGTVRLRDGHGDSAGTGFLGSPRIGYTVWADIDLRGSSGTTPVREVPLAS